MPSANWLRLDAQSGAGLCAEGLKRDEVAMMLSVLHFIVLIRLYTIGIVTVMLASSIGTIVLPPVQKIHQALALWQLSVMCAHIRAHYAPVSGGKWARYGCGHASGRQFNYVPY